MVDKHKGSFNKSKSQNCSEIICRKWIDIECYRVGFVTENKHKVIKIIHAAYFSMENSMEMWWYRKKWCYFIPIGGENIQSRTYILMSMKFWKYQYTLVQSKVASFWNVSRGLRVPSWPRPLGEPPPMFSQITEFGFFEKNYFFHFLNPKTHF